MLQARVDIRSAQADLNRIGKQFRFAQTVALTQTAKWAQTDLRREVRKVFDRPTPYTQNAVYWKPASLNRPVAEVGFRGANPERHYLVPQVHGGGRDLKRFEFHLRRAGVLGVSEHVVPASGYPLDAYGNIPRRVYSAILSDVRAHPDRLAWSSPESRGKRSRRRMIAKRAIYFAIRPGSHLPPGIYERVRTVWGSGVRGVFMFVRQPTYRARLPMQQIVQKTINDRLEGEFEKAFAQALRSEGKFPDSASARAAWRAAR